MNVRHPLTGVVSYHWYGGTADDGRHGGMVGDGEGMVGQLVTAWQDGW